MKRARVGLNLELGNVSSLIKTQGLPDSFFMRVHQAEPMNLCTVPHTDGEYIELCPIDTLFTSYACNSSSRTSARHGLGCCVSGEMRFLRHPDYRCSKSASGGLNTCITRQADADICTSCQTDGVYVPRVSRTECLCHDSDGPSQGNPLQRTSDDVIIWRLGTAWHSSTTRPAGHQPASDV